MQTQRSQTRLGIAMGVGAYTLWGVLPLFIRQLHALSALAILSHRVVWSLLILIVLACATKRWAALGAALRNPRILLALCASSLLIATNWLLYIYSVNSGHTLEASLGYFTNPLVNVLLGFLFFRERFTRLEGFAILLAAAGVGAITIHHGSLPYIPLGLALSFGLYGFVRKTIGLGPVEGLLIETALLSPFALGWLLTMPATPASIDAPPLWMVMASGVVTTVPLLLFAGAANRIRYSELGLLQYIGPTLSMLLAVQVFGEPLLPIHLLTFGLIWTGLALYVVGSWHRGRVGPTVPE